MSSPAAVSRESLPPFRNEPYTDFNRPENRHAMQEALAAVRAEFGREYELILAGERVRAPEKLISRNPSAPEEIVGIHQRATPEQAREAIERAFRYFPVWCRRPAEERAARLLEAARILRRRKMEFNAWLIYEAGKTWPEAEADVSEAIDFCEYYAREMLRLAGPHPMIQ
ncbi:MAG: aldehyde dehydrogenase family protein, partial [Bryobacteraceae bacterium]